MFRKTALTLSALFLAAGCGAGTSESPASSPSPTALVTPSASASAPQPTTAPTLPPTSAPTAVPTQPSNLPAFACANAQGGGGAGAQVVAVRAAAQDGYDRFVIEFAGGPVPPYEVTRQATPVFTLSPKGTDVTLAGSAGVRVVVRNVLDWTSYSAPTHLAPGLPMLKEAMQTENFEAIQQWGLGVASSGCLRAFTLDGPPRLVIDLRT